MNRDGSFAFKVGYEIHTKSGFKPTAEFVRYSRYGNFSFGYSTEESTLNDKHVWARKFPEFKYTMDNAVKYNHPGGHVYVTLKPIGMKCQLRVKDTGIGIPEDKQQRVFERFYRVDASRSKKNGGTGLGLSIVKHIVEQHHGTIALKSRENEGTEITVVM